ncbi:MAG: DUF4383 domain-containing protein [Actinomycetota bacterium]
MVTQTSLSPAQIVALGFGVVYMLIGLVGFAATGFDGWIAQNYTEKLLLFPINPLHNIVHIALGVVWMFSASTHAGAKRINQLLGVVLLAVAALGFLGVLKFLAIEKATSPDNFLHLVSALVALYFGTIGATER